LGRTPTPTFSTVSLDGVKTPTVSSPRFEVKTKSA
jgi:hypothetical protein